MLCHQRQLGLLKGRFSSMEARKNEGINLELYYQSARHIYFDNNILEIF